GDRFTVKHPSLLSFVETAKADARLFVQLIHDVKHNRRDPPPHDPNVEPRIPVEFHDFECSKIQLRPQTGLVALVRPRQLAVSLRIGCASLLCTSPR
ncbi:hypothetical protein JG687_00009366, partial [Phytophthora cactorum]